MRLSGLALKTNYTTFASSPVNSLYMHKVLYNSLLLIGKLFVYNPVKIKT